MRRFLTSGILVVCVLSVLGAAGQQPVFRGVGDAVRVFATVTDRDGQLVTTLAQDDFECATRGSHSRSRCSTTPPSVFG